MDKNKYNTWFGKISDAFVEASRHATSKQRGVNLARLGEILAMLITTRATEKSTRINRVARAERSLDASVNPPR